MGVHLEEVEGAPVAEEPRDPVPLVQAGPVAEAPGVVSLPEAVERHGTSAHDEVTRDPAALLVVAPGHRLGERTRRVGVVGGGRTQAVPLEVGLGRSVGQLHRPCLAGLKHPVGETVGGHHVPVGGRDGVELTPVAVGQLPVGPHEHPTRDPPGVGQHRDPRHHEGVGGRIPGVEVERVAPVGRRILHRVQAFVVIGGADGASGAHPSHTMLCARSPWSSPIGSRLSMWPMSPW